MRERTGNAGMRTRLQALRRRMRPRGRQAPVGRGREVSLGGSREDDGRVSRTASACVFGCPADGRPAEGRPSGRERFSYNLRGGTIDNTDK